MSTYDTQRENVNFGRSVRLAKNRGLSPKKIREIELVESMQITNVRGSKIRLSVQVEGEIQRFYTAMLRSGHFARRRADQLADGFTIHLNWIAK